MSRVILDLDDAGDRAMAGTILAGVVNSEAWPVLRQLAAWIRERDIEKLPTTIDALAALNGRQAGMKALLDGAEKMAEATTTVAPVDKQTLAQQVITGLTKSLLPGSGPV